LRQVKETHIICKHKNNSSILIAAVINHFAIALNTDLIVNELIRGSIYSRLPATHASAMVAFSRLNKLTTDINTFAW